MDVTATQLLEKDIENLARGEQRGSGVAAPLPWARGGFFLRLTPVINVRECD